MMTGNHISSGKTTTERLINVTKKIKRSIVETPRNEIVIVGDEIRSL